MAHSPTTLLCVSITGPRLDDAVAQIRAARCVADLLELRVDLFSSLELASIRQLMELCSLPVILTLRSTSHGGHFAGTPEERLALLERLGALNPAYLDVECDLLPHLRSRLSPEVRTICSYHNMEETPIDLSALVDCVMQEPADLYKVACMAHSTLDALRMLEQMRRRPGLIGICMGDDGISTRILSPLFGAPLTFASVSESGEAAPGQLTAQTLTGTYRFRELGPQSMILGLIGGPVFHSVGLLAHNAVLDRCELDGVYVPFRLSSDCLPTFFQWIRESPVLGLSVTMPLKQAVIPFLDVLDAPAKAIGAVNTIHVADGELHGSNQDAPAALDAIEAERRVAGKRMLVIGAGGAARAIVYEALQRGAEVLIVNRTGEKGAELARELGCRGGGFDLLDTNYEIMVQCTSVGMAPLIEEMPIGEEWIREGALVLDIITAPPVTQLLEVAARLGCKTIAGLEMWINQAFRQLTIWFGDEIEARLAQQVLRESIESHHLRGSR